MQYIEFTATPIKQALKDGTVSLQLDIAAARVLLDQLKGAMDRVCLVTLAVPDPAVQTDLDQLFEAAASGNGA